MSLAQLLLLCALMTVVVHFFVADSSLLDCCDLVMCFWRFEVEFFPSRLPCGQSYKFRFEAKTTWYSAEVLATQMGVTEAQHQSQLV